MVLMFIYVHKCQKFDHCTFFNRTYKYILDNKVLTILYWLNNSQLISDYHFKKSCKCLHWALKFLDKDCWFFIPWLSIFEFFLSDAFFCFKMYFVISFLIVIIDSVILHCSVLSCAMYYETKNTSFDKYSFMHCAMLDMHFFSLNVFFSRFLCFYPSFIF